MTKTEIAASMLGLALWLSYGLGQMATALLNMTFDARWGTAADPKNLED